ncbi:hypothetical protein JOM56_015633 [Amanita muscaria]
MPFTPAPATDEILALNNGFYLGSDSLPDDLKFAYSRDLNASVLVSTRAMDEPREVCGVFKISRDSFTFTPTAGYDMVNKPPYDRDKNDDTCWLNLRPAINLLAHDVETVPGGSTSDWGKYIANMKEIEKRFKDTGERQTVLLENWGIKLAHKFLVEVHVPAQLDEIVKLMEHVQKLLVICRGDPRVSESSPSPAPVKTLTRTQGCGLSVPTGKGTPSGAAGVKTRGWMQNQQRPPALRLKKKAKENTHLQHLHMPTSPSKAGPCRRHGMTLANHSSTEATPFVLWTLTYTKRINLSALPDMNAN